MDRPRAIRKAVHQTGGYACRAPLLTAHDAARSGEAGSGRSARRVALELHLQPSQPQAEARAGQGEQLGLVAVAAVREGPALVQEDAHAEVRETVLADQALEVGGSERDGLAHGERRARIRERLDPQRSELGFSLRIADPGGEDQLRRRIAEAALGHALLSARPSVVH